MKRLRLDCIATILLLAGCANGFSKYYTAAPNIEAGKTAAYALPGPERPQIYLHGSDLQADAHRMAEDGYLYLGQSSFFGPANKVTQEQAIEQAKLVGAAVVLFKSQYMDTRSGYVPLTLPNAPVVSTISTSGTVNAYGSGGYATGNYNSTGTITTPGGYNTVNIPYSVDRDTFFASYWAKRDISKIKLGVQWTALPDDMRRKLERNTGVFVTVVVRGTPAFTANILEGDVILKANGIDIVDVQGASSLTASLAGQSVVFDILRDGQPRTITVRLNP